MKLEPIDSVTNVDESLFKRISDEGKPVLMKNCDFGVCMHIWNLEYLNERLENRDITIHESTESSLNFLKKNFAYKSCKFSEFAQILKKQSDPCQKSVYLRSIASNSKKPARIDTDFPEISDDLKPPSFIPYGNENKLYHSSVLRIASKDVEIWTHFDLYNNVLVQLVGAKRVLLIPPEDSKYLYLEGDKSRLFSFESPVENIHLFPLVHKARIYVAHLSPGDCLYIPSLWWHNIKTKTETSQRGDKPDYSIGFNIFWRDPQIECNSYYARNDVYGNRNLLPYESALSNLDKAVEHLNKLPEKYRQLYTEMLYHQFRKKFKIDDPT